MMTINVFFFKRPIVLFLILFLFLSIESNAKSKPKAVQSDRDYWINEAYRMSKPVLENLANNTLKKNMPVESIDEGRKKFAYLEALGRLLSGISPWLELPPDSSDEGIKRSELLKLAHQGIANSLNHDGPDYIGYHLKPQAMVDAAFLAEAFIRSPKNLWGGLDSLSKSMLISEFKICINTIKPPLNNWLLFAAMLEAFLLEFDGNCDLMHTDYAFRQMDSWYVGDGLYKDGPTYHEDYYNSFVIHPMLIDAGRILNKRYKNSEALYSDANIKIIEERASRYASILERKISPEGTFPVVGRSILYRTGCMHALAQVSLLKLLPKDVSEGQVRAALTQVMKRILSNETTYKNGWLTMGFCGNQKETAEYYLNTGSMYLAAEIFLPLGLPASDSFWTSPAEEWTSVKAWNGKAFPRDHAIEN